MRKEMGVSLAGCGLDAMAPNKLRAGKPTRSRSSLNSLSCRCFTFLARMPTVCASSNSIQSGESAEAASVFLTSKYFLPNTVTIWRLWQLNMWGVAAGGASYVAGINW
jgi:hypothetical protein